MNSKTLRAVAILVGTTIGAGIFGIPYAVTQVGFGAGLLYLLALGGVVLLLNLLYGEVILRTRGDHQFTGYGQIYLGKVGKSLAGLGLLVSCYGALLAYLIKIGEFLGLIFNPPYSLEFSLIFFTLASIAIFFGLRAISQIELLLVGLILAFILTLALIGLPHISSISYQLSAISYSNLFLPYGVILFALAGSAAIPEMEEILRRQPKRLKKAIITGTLIPLLTYLIFTWAIIGICGQKTSDDAISSLNLFLPGWIVRFGAGLGVLTMGTSFLALGYVLREVWYRDYNLPKIAALGLACFPSLIFFLLGAKNFIAVLEITGAITVGLSGLLILLLYRKARLTGQKEPAYQLKVPSAILWLLGLIFLLGMFSPWL